MISNFPDFPHLQTKRVQTRPLALSDAREICELRSDQNIARLAGREPAQHISDAVSFIHNIQDSLKSNISLYWAMVFKGRSELIGTACLWNFDLENKSVEIGYELIAKHHGQGIMSEFLPELIRFGFNIVMAEYLIAEVSPDNAASRKLLERVGFKPDSGSQTIGGEDPAQVLRYTINKLRFLKQAKLQN